MQILHIFCLLGHHRPSASLDLSNEQVKSGCSVCGAPSASSSYAVTKGRRQRLQRSGLPVIGMVGLVFVAAFAGMWGRAITALDPSTVTVHLPPPDTIADNQSRSATLKARGSSADAAPDTDPTVITTSRYTSLDPATCVVVEEIAQLRGSIRRCSGSAGYALETSDSGLGLDISTIAPNGRRSGLRIANLVANGARSRLGKNAEWRGPAGEEARALIIRIVADPESTGRDPSISNLLVIRLRQPTCVVAVVPRAPGQNERARAIADGKLQRCLGGSQQS